ncbi:preprotein translocase subunit SecG [Fulvitalea axinellae]|uniref:Protein-export membrane protein SecG n=1 Tax=Fulvitalea axinellae TaxID=1182444 RepID=A0AAU9D187_9BACT|nr:preprotein translocase subunit SecG [Fulvitalea axinellae]
MFNILITLIVIVSLLLIFAILMQKSKGSGLSGQFGGSAGQLMGAKRSADFLEKATWGLSIILVTLTLATNITLDSGPKAYVSPNLKKAQEQQGQNAIQSLHSTTTDSAAQSTDTTVKK